MERISLKCLSILAAVSVGACGNTANFTPVSTSNSQEIGINSQTGKPYIKSVQSNSAVALQQTHQKGFDEVGTLFDLKLKTRGYQVFPFGPSNIEVRQGEHVCKVLGYDEAYAKVKRIENTKQALNMFAIVLGGVAAGYGASAGGAGGLAAIAMFPVTTMAATNNIEASSAEIDSFSSESSRVFLRPVNVPPRSELGALFAVEGLSASEPTSISIRVGEDTHNVTFQPTPTAN